jgi:hypothetical protein
MKYVIRWRQRNGRERPVVEKASGEDLRYNLGCDSKREVIESSLKQHRRSLERAKQSVAAYERCVADLERLLAKESAQ